MSTKRSEACCRERRDFLKQGAFGLLGMGLASQFFLRDAYGITPDLNAKKYDACLQIFYSGGPSQTDTWDPKPNSTSNAFNTINLGVNDIYGSPVHISDVFPDLANLAMNDPAVGLGMVRSMSHGNGSHSSAQQWMNCMWQSPVADLYPSISSAMAYYMADQTPGLDISSVLIRGSNGDQANDAKGGGTPNAFTVVSQGSARDMVRRPNGVAQSRYQRRKAITGIFNQGYQRPDALRASWDGALQQAYDVTTSGNAAAAFDLTNVTRLPGGPNASGTTLTHLTLAQQLIGAGIPYVAVGIGGNDTHSGNMARVRRNWGDQTDTPVAQMLENLKATGKRVLVVMGGEFGRSPTDVAPDGNGAVRDGRDHWASGFSWAMASLNQPNFITTAVGDTGPNGANTTRSSTPLVDPVAPSAFGGMLYTAMGYPIADPRFTVPTAVGDRPPVDLTVANTANPGGTPWLLNQFGLA
jgi:hypothetical protein